MPILKDNNRYSSVTVTAAGAWTATLAKAVIRTMSTMPMPPGTGLRLAAPEPALHTTTIFAQGAGATTRNRGAEEAAHARAQVGPPPGERSPEPPVREPQVTGALECGAEHRGHIAARPAVHPPADQPHHPIHQRGQPGAEP